MLLSRIEFDRACKSFINLSKGWTWNEHATVPGLGFMSRSAVVFQRPADKIVAEDSDDPSLHAEQYEHLEDVDAATVDSTSAGEALSSRQFVVYSPTFQVPVFYFTVHDSNGRPLQLTELINTSLFHPFELDGTDATSFALSPAGSSFPLLSQGDHPTLGTPCWYLHPCQTAAAVDEVMKEVETQDWTEDQRLLRWMEVWFMVLGSIVDLRR